MKGKIQVTRSNSRILDFETVLLTSDTVMDTCMSFQIQDFKQTHDIFYYEILGVVVFAKLI